MKVEHRAQRTPAMRGLGIKAALAALVLVAALPTARAALPDCRPSESAPFVVFLSEPSFTPAAFASRPQMVSFFNRLQEHLDQRRDLEMAELASAPFRVARCEGRVPAIDGKDFTREVVRSLYNRNVVIEIWGELDADLKNGERTNLRAHINYLLMPLRRASDSGKPAAPSFHRFNYPDHDIVASDFVDLISNGDLYAFVATAIGMMAYDGDDFAQAHQLLCIASPKLARIQQRLALSPQTQAQSQTIASLRGFVRNLAADAMARAGTSSPALALIASADDPCGENKVRP